MALSNLTRVLCKKPVTSAEQTSRREAEARSESVSAVSGAMRDFGINACASRTIRPRRKANCGGPVSCAASNSSRTVHIPEHSLARSHAVSSGSMLAVGKADNGMTCRDTAWNAGPSSSRVQYGPRSFARRSVSTDSTRGYMNGETKTNLLRDSGGIGLTGTGRSLLIETIIAASDAARKRISASTTLTGLASAIVPTMISKISRRCALFATSGFTHSRIGSRTTLFTSADPYSSGLVSVAWS